jgi:hypothetical protein
MGAFSKIMLPDASLIPSPYRWLYTNKAKEAADIRAPKKTKTA